MGSGQWGSSGEDAGDASPEGKAPLAVIISSLQQHDTGQRSQQAPLRKARSLLPSV